MASSSASWLGNVVQNVPYLVASLVEVVDLFMNSSTQTSALGIQVVDGVYPNCSSVSSSQNVMEMSFMGLSVLLLIVLSFFVPRVSFKRHCCHRRPGLLLPMDLIEKHHQSLEFTLAFLSVSEDIYNFIFGSKADFGPMVPIAKFFLKLVFVGVLSVTSYLTFAGLQNRLLVGYLFAAVMCACYSYSDISRAVNFGLCLAGTKTVPFILSALVHCGLDLVLLAIFLVRMLSHVRHHGFRRVGPALDSSLAQKRLCILYIRELLRRKEEDREEEDREEERTQEERTQEEEMTQEERTQEEEMTQEERTQEEVRGQGERTQEERTQEERTQEDLEVKDQEERTQRKELKAPSKLLQARLALYPPMPGFSLPPRLLIGISVGSFFAYRLLVDQIYDMTPTVWTFLSLLNLQLGSTSSNISSAFQVVSNLNSSSLYSSSDLLNSYRFLVMFYAQLLVGCVLTGVLVSVLNSLIHTFLIIRNYRLDFWRLSRQGFSSLVPLEHAPPPYGLVLGFLKFGGFQAAHILWGILVMFLAVSLVLYLVIGLFLLPLFYIQGSWPQVLLIKYSPVVVASLLLNVLQTQVVKHLFVKECGLLMEVDNPRAFIILCHCAFFFNTLMGIFSAIQKILVSVVSGLVCFCRIDFCALPTYLRSLDSGYMCYLGFLYTEHYHHNLILRYFVSILLESRTNVDLDTTSTSNYQYDDSSQTTLSFQNLSKNKTSSSSSSSKYRNKWAVAYTLIRNKSLLAERKTFWNNTTL